MFSSECAKVSSKSEIVVVQSRSHVRLFVISWTAACWACLSSTVYCSLLKLVSIELMMTSNRLVLYCPLPLLLSIFPASRSFPMSWFFTSGGQSIGALASTSVLPMNIQGRFLLGLTGLVFQSKGLSRVFSNTTVRSHQFFCYLVGFSCSYYSSINREFETKYPQQGSMVERTVPESGGTRFKF